LDQITEHAPGVSYILVIGNATPNNPLQKEIHDQ